ncbi:AAA family ATPase [Microvirga antarctica]|uniref:AAA family ATPase n=1 Tax=Microvirga antarctica TaxID=2819233 RepID=UPI001B3122BB|nr:adenylate/guanylate cyclase domain-containing protein [Microvirga antarctica]
MQVDSSPDSLTRFVPGTLLDWSDEYDTKSHAPLREIRLGALMITDISGFTRLTAKLSRAGSSAGAEYISEVLNTFVTRLVTLTEQQGGRVLSFEGDSIVAGWRAQSDQDLTLAAWRASYCAQVLHQRAGRHNVAGEVLTIRSGVAAGTTYLLHVLSAARPRRVILTGPASDQVLRCASLAESGEVLVAEETWPYLAEHAEGRSPESGAVHLVRIDPPPAARIEPAPHPPGRGINPELYLLPALRARLASSLSRWLGELRTVTVLFVRIGEQGLFDDLERLEGRLTGLQTEIARFDGEILRVEACDGDLRILVVFGLPGAAHGDDPRRAVLTALALGSMARRADTRFSVGIATGEAFCGAIGAPHRADYTVIGEAVNRGARLSATSAGRILTDEPTANAARAYVTFDGPWPLQVPGLRVPIRSFIALRSLSDSPGHAASELVGRETELDFLETFLDRVGEPEPRPLVIVGEAGIGKSALVEAVVAKGQHRRIRLLYGASDDVERSTPYFVFRPLLRDLLGIADRKGPEALLAIGQALKSRDMPPSSLSLLRDLFDLGSERTAPIDQLAGHSRSDSLRRLLRDLILAKEVGPRTVIVLEDLHWVDPASRLLIEDLIRDPARLPLILTTRELAPCQDMMGGAPFNLLKLGPLDEKATIELVRRSLPSPEAAASVQDFIWSRTAGNPFFTAELCRVIAQRPISAGAADNVSPVVLPRSARAAILGRTDLLPPDEQVLLKIASAAGADFSVEDLVAIDVVRAAGIDVSAGLENLRERQLFKPAPTAPGRLIFAHAIIRDVVYQSMLLEQRKLLHAAIARAREADGSREIDALPFILGQWQRAGNRPKILEYLDQVAELRLRQYDNASVIDLIEDFLTFAAEDHIAIAVKRRASAYLLMAEAHLNLGRVDPALDAYQTALRLLGLPLPRTAMALCANIARQVISLACRRLRRSNTPWIETTDVLRTIPRDDIFVQAAKAHEDLTRIYYFRSEKARLLHATLRATNLAERYPKLTPVLAVNYASLGAICGVIPLRRQARTYLTLASRVAARVDSPVTDAQVHLLAGLYETSIAHWQEAKSHFTQGLDQAAHLGDWRRWSEIAVSLETITSPWFLTPIYAGEAAWTGLVESVRSTGKHRSDLQVLGCGLVAGLRGYTALGREEAASGCLSELRLLLREHSAGLEMIHRLEAAAYLADEALRQGAVAEGREWLTRAHTYLLAINPAMKSRTLPALGALLAVASRHETSFPDREVREICGTLGTTGGAKLARFARVYPIGRPRSCLHHGDRALTRGRRANAVRWWRRALAEALQLDLPVDGCEALRRLRTSGITLSRADGDMARRLRSLLPAHRTEWRELLEASGVERT